MAAAVGLLLIALSGRYGYHRDEFYFLTAGKHLAWGYPDQPPFVPVLARLMSAIDAHSVVVLRLPASLAGAGIVAMTAPIAREFGASKPAQVLAAAVMALAAIVLAGGHLLGTTAFNLLAWAVLLWLVIRLLRTDDARLWVPIGLVAGIGLLDNTLVAFLAFGLAVGLIAVGPRRHFRSGWLWAGVVVAAALWLPYLVWQAQHGWPQIAESRAIAAGQSGTSQPRWLVLPFQVLLVGPATAPVWIAGLVRLLRSPDFRWARSLGVAYVAVAVVVVVTGGKGYYLGGFYPLLVGAGAEPALAWVRRAASPRRAVVSFVVFSLPVVVIALPVLPQRAFMSSGLVGLNWDLGEQIGWKAYVQEVAAAYHNAGSPAAIVTSNYGEAGAIDHYGGAYGLPHAYSGQTGYWDWGPPPASATSVLAVGFDRTDVTRYCSEALQVGRLDNHHDFNNAEQHRPIWRCQLRESWSTIWPQLKST